MAGSGCAVPTRLLGLEVEGLQEEGDCLENKKGPGRGPMHTARIWMALAIPGGAPGYDDDKQFGNFITHRSAQASQRLREHTAEASKVKSQAEITLNFEFSEVPSVRRG
jgi:hypothetical protein